MIKLQDADNGQYYFTLIARNGEVVMDSKMYDRKDVARDSAEAIKDMDFEVGDFCVRKKPGPKPQDSKANGRHEGVKSEEQMQFEQDVIGPE